MWYLIGAAVGGLLGGFGVRRFRDRPAKMKTVRTARSAAVSSAPAPVGLPAPWGGMEGVRR